MEKSASSIERHRGNHNGSTRANVQTWAVDLVSNSSAAIASETYRQVKPRARSYTKADAKKDAQAVLRILTGRRKNRGELVQEGEQSYSLLASSFVDLGEFKRTRAGRRRQFIAALEEVMGSKGWRVSADPWEPTAIQVRKSGED